MHEAPTLGAHTRKALWGRQRGPQTSALLGTLPPSLLPTPRNPPTGRAPSFSPSTKIEGVFCPFSLQETCHVDQGLGNALNFHTLLGREKELATPSSILTRRIPWTEESGGPQSTVLRRVEHDRVTSLWMGGCSGLAEGGASPHSFLSQISSPSSTHSHSYQISEGVPSPSPGENKAQVKLSLWTSSSC